MDLSEVSVSSIAFILLHDNTELLHELETTEVYYINLPNMD
jgi:hypothetical protein